MQAGGGADGERNGKNHKQITHRAQSPTQEKLNLMD